MSAPRVSVLLSVYNGERFLAQAVDSILGQTFTDFEFILVDDGSTDQSAAILNGFSDPRIVRLNNERNLGLARSLNIGLATARGEYIARIDADDTARPERLARQVAFLDDHPEVVCAGANFEVIDETGRVLYSTDYPAGGLFVKWTGLYRNIVGHSTVCFRTRAARRIGGYEERENSQDYGLWSRWQYAEGQKIYGLAETLGQVRQHANRISNDRLATQRESTQIVRRNIEWLLKRPVGEEVARVLFSPASMEDPELARVCVRTFSAMLEEFWNQFPPPELRSEIVADFLTRLSLIGRPADKFLVLKLGLQGIFRYSPAALLSKPGLRFLKGFLW